jgi:hypothetical protein
MSTGGIVEAVKPWICREVKVLGWYSLWRSLGTVSMLIFLTGSTVGAVKPLYDTPTTNLSLFATPVKQLQDYLRMFLLSHPTFAFVWDLMPGFDLGDPLTLFTSGWLIWVPFAGLGAHLMRRKVKENPSASSITVNGDVGMMNTGILAVKHIESIAAHLNRLSFPVEKRVVDAIAEVTKAVTKDQTLDAAARAEVLDLLMALAQQTASPPAGRSRGVGRAMVRTLDAALSTAGNLADIWSAWGQPIKAFFEF